MRLIVQLLTAAAILAIPTSALAQAQFSAGTGPGNNSGGGPCNPNTAIAGGSSSAPTSASIVCAGERGSTAGSANARFGHIGASSSAVTVTDSSVSLFNGASASFFDQVMFTSTDPSATTVDVAVNFAFSGVLNTSVGTFGPGNASIFIEAVLGQGAQSGSFVYNDNTQANFPARRNDFLTIDGTAGGALNNALLRTPTVTLNLNAPQQFFIRMLTSADAVGTGASSRSDFSNSFGLPTGSDAFFLPAGFTVNSVSGGWLVNNRLVDPNAMRGAIPEPSTWAMLIAGFGLIGLALRRRPAAGWRAA